MVNAPIADEVITEIKRVVDIPVIATIASVHTDVRRKLEAGADILNVSGAAATASMVAEIRKEYPVPNAFAVYKKYLDQRYGGEEE